MKYAKLVVFVVVYSIVLAGFIWPIRVLSQPKNQLRLEQIIYATPHHEKNFDKFLDDWSKEYSPKDASNENDTVKAVYELYQQLFTPFDLNGKASFDGGEDINDGIKNVVVLGSYRYYINNKGRWDYKTGCCERVINEFRPKLDFGKDVRILYLTDKYDSLLNQFLGSESTEFGTPSVMSPSRAKGQSADREAFVKKFLPIVHGHWGNYWHLGTMPTMTFVFNPTLDKVEVKFRIGYGGRIKNYERKNGMWEEIKSQYIEEWVE